MIIYAVNINTGGGKVLLDRLLKDSPFGPASAAFIDARYNPPADSKGNIVFFSYLPKTYSRLKAERKLHQYINELSISQTVLFFGNLPPFFKPKAKSILYLQNCYLTRQMPAPADSIAEKLRNIVESWILKLFYTNIDEIWVQTNWMQRITQQRLPNAKIEVRPFLPELPAPKERTKIYDFIFVGSYAINKRLAFFLEALNVMDSELTRKIRVAVVVDGKKKNVDAFKFKNIDLHLMQSLNRSELFSIYEQSRTLVATSLYESFYLPIYEAKHFNLNVIAPETGYTENLNIDKYPIQSVAGLKQLMLKTIN